jgi:hypothetical protein
MIWIKKYMATKPHQEYIYTYFCKNDIEKSNQYQYYMNSKSLSGSASMKTKTSGNQTVWMYGK